MIFATSAVNAKSSSDINVADTTPRVTFFRSFPGISFSGLTYVEMKNNDTLRGCQNSFVTMHIVNFTPCITHISWVKLGSNIEHQATWYEHNPSHGFLFSADLGNVSNGVYVVKTTSTLLGSVNFDTLVVSLGNSNPIKPRIVDLAGMGGLHCGSTNFELTLDSLQNFSNHWWYGAMNKVDTLKLDKYTDEKLCVRAVDKNGCMVFSDTMIVKNYEATTPTIQFGDQKLFTNLTGTFNWYIDSNIVATNSNNYFYPKVTGNYQVQFVDFRGCKSSLSTNSCVVVPKVISSDTVVLNAGSNSVQIPLFKSYNDYKAVVCWKVTKNGVLIQDKCIRTNEISYIDVTEGVYFINSTSSFGIESTDTIVVLKRKTTGLNDISKLIEVFTYPNPFTDSFTISNQNGSKIVIFDLTGKSIFETILQSNEEIIKPEIPSGLYLLKIYNNDQYIGYKKILKD